MKFKSKLLIALGAIIALLSFSHQAATAQAPCGCAATSPLYNQRVLLIGDSQTKGQFGIQLSYLLSHRGIDYFYRDGRVGWGVYNWWNERKAITKLIKFAKPTVILVELGGNDMWASDRIDYEYAVRRLWHFINEQKTTGTKVLWISPATVVGKSADKQPARDEIAEVIKEQIGKEHYVESRDITGDFGRDSKGLHFTPSGGKKWAEQIIPRIEEKLNAL